MAVRVPIVFLLTALIFITVKYWGIKARQDTCLLSLDRQLKLVKSSDEELDETKDRCERQVAEKDMEIGTVKRDRSSFERRLSVCEQEKTELLNEQKKIEKENEEVVKDNENVLKQANNDLNELLEKFSKMKKEYERSLASEAELRKERDDLKEERDTLDEELEAEKDKSAKMSNKAKQYKVEMEEAKEEMLKQQRILEVAVKKESSKEKNVKPEDDKHFYEKKVIQSDDNKEPKRAIIDQEVEEAFAKVGANPNDVGLVKNETFEDIGNDNSKEGHEEPQLDVGNDDHQVQEPHIGNKTLIEEADNEVGQFEKKEVGGNEEEEEIDDKHENAAAPQIEDPDLLGGKDTLSEEVEEREKEEDFDADVEEKGNGEKPEDGDENQMEESELKGLNPDGESFDNEFETLEDDDLVMNAI